MMNEDMLQGAADKQAEIDHTLDDYERELLQAIEEGQLASTTGPIPDKNRLEEAARNTLAKSERLTIRLTKMDLQALKHCAAREGVPYHTLISSVLHKYVTGQLVPQQAPRS
jgi:predicted DNA binding CopG/RHH family protein